MTDERPVIDIEKLNGAYLQSENRGNWEPKTYSRAQAIAHASRQLRKEGGGTVRVFDQSKRKDGDEPDEEIRVFA